MENSQNELIKNISDSLTKKMESIFIDGLKLKGFEFENRKELELFVKSNCRAEYLEGKMEKVYYVNNIPFLLHKYSFDISPICEVDGSIKISGNYGSYSYL